FPTRRSSDLAVQLGNNFLRRITWTAKLDVIARTRRNFRFRQNETKEPDLHAAKLAHDETLRAAERLTGALVDYIRRNPAKLRLRNTLRQHVWTKVELMIAVGRVVETDRIPRFDHLRALVSDRLD